MDRLGLVLNFVASFLIAPELIGRRRIQLAESGIENYAQYFFHAMAKFSHRARQLLPDGWQGWLYICIGTPLVVFASGLWPPFLPPFNTEWHDWLQRLKVVAMLGAIAGGLLNPLIASSEFPKAPKARASGFAKAAGLGLVMGAIGLPLALLWPATLAAAAICGLVILSVRAFLGFLLRILFGKGRLESLLVALGILFLVLGNGLQLAATFLIGS